MTFNITNFPTKSVSVCQSSNSRDHHSSMSFRKRNVALDSSTSKAASIDQPSTTNFPLGVRPSPLDGRSTTSTGTQTLDDLLGGHAGFPLGTSILLEENGTTDFAGAVLRFYAAEGVVQGHQVHVIGVGEQWGRDLPGLTALSTTERGGKEPTSEKERMKIAWRYESLGDFGVGKEYTRGGFAHHTDLQLFALK